MPDVSDSSFPVSVILCTYNPDWRKLKATLLSAVMQEGIDFEIVLTDDGSGEDHFREAAALLDSRGFSNYRIVKNETNVGTVRNLLGAAGQARGEYVAAISPGDMYYDGHVLKCLYDFAKARDAEVCFCDAVYYDSGDGVRPVGGIPAAPAYPQLFADDTPLKLQQTAFIWGNYVLGATLFMKRENAVRYYELASRGARYIEDTFSLMYMTLAGIRIYHCPVKGIWYEYGIGLSTSTASAAFGRMKTDMDNSFRVLSDYRPYCPALAARCRIRFLRNPVLRIGYLLFRHPLVSLGLLRIFTMKRSILDPAGVCTALPEKLLEVSPGRNESETR